MEWLRNDDIGKLILRILVGGMMLFHGIGKLVVGIDFIEQVVVSSGLPSFVAYGVYIGEIVAPLMLIVGFKTRIASIVIIINMIFAIALAHSADILKLNAHGGLVLELHWFYIVTAGAITFLGAGKYSVCKGKCKYD